MIHRVRTTLSFIAVFCKLHPPCLCVYRSRSLSSYLTNVVWELTKWPPIVSDDERQNYNRCFGVNAVLSSGWVSP